MNISKIQKDAIKLAAKAKPGFMHHGGKLYTFEFCQREWVYKVYEDGFYMLSYNTRKLSTAKSWLKEHLAN